jgi:serine/threonine-protein kinase ATR
MIFRLVDHISKRASICRLRAGKLKSRMSSNSTHLGTVEKEFKILEKFLRRIPQSMLATAARRSHAYARALMHYENYFREERRSKSQSQLQPLYLELQKIHAKLEDADALSGLSTKITDQSLENQILGHEVAGRWSSAQSCYEVLLQNDHLSSYENGILNCLQNMGHYGMNRSFGLSLFTETL